MSDREPEAAAKSRKPRAAHGRRLEPSAGYPADKRSTEPEAVARSGPPERDRQHGDDDS